MKSYAETHSEHIRLSVLKLLAGQPSYKANDSVLTQAVEGFGLQCTRDQMRGHLRWLGEQLLIRTETTGSGKPIIIAELTEQGGDVARGASFREGVQRPSPGE